MAKLTERNSLKLPKASRDPLHKFSLFRHSTLYDNPDLSATCYPCRIQDQPGTAAAVSNLAITRHGDHARSAVRFSGAVDRRGLCCCAVAPGERFPGGSQAREKSDGFLCRYRPGATAVDLRQEHSRTDSR